MDTAQHYCDGCLGPVSNLTMDSFANTTTSSSHGAPLALFSVIMYLKWTSVCVVYDHATERHALELVDRLSREEIFVVMYDMKEVTSSKIDALSSTKLMDYPDKINFTLLCRTGPCKSFLQKPFKFDRRNVWRNSLLHFSRWLVGVFDDVDIENLDTFNNIPFDNLAVLHLITAGYETQKDPDLNVINSAPSCRWSSLYTLLWGKDRRRYLSHIGYASIDGRPYITSTIFPNVKFGFNGRRFLINTLPWAPFVMLDEETNTYTGITIELLKELSTGMNFTYDLEPPPDGKWGARVIVENNTWTGMIGQLQRRDIDLIVAPLAINSHRETVMDFTHPYFYEFSAILLKKPNPNDTRWTTLLNPFSPTVFMFIGISLPVFSMFLFSFEKYNPFYRQILKRGKIRGLHHFSDSFWYMYGALLTQGGEHIAESSSGRTILSCWWIFCIVMVATYSGNFVAFLTVSKEKLPFDNLEQMVSQSKYKWGTPGATIYETIFKNSDLSERKTLWSGILKFNESDPTVLSSYPDVHIAKVIQGDYAYVGDKTNIELAMTSNCDLAMATADILPVQYAVGLPNHSPLVQLFSDEIIAILESGLIQMWKTQIWPKNGQCREMSAPVAKTISLLDIQIAFYLIGMGVFLALLALVYEHSKQRVVECKRRKRGEYGRRKSVVLTKSNSGSSCDNFYSLSPSKDKESPVNNAIQRQLGNAFSRRNNECPQDDSDGLKENGSCNMEVAFNSETVHL